jgi:hypothetical protein
MSMMCAGLVLAAAGTALAACGTDSGTARTAEWVPADNGVAALAPADILKRAKAALAKTKSFHVKGDTSDEGQHIEMDVKVSGADFAGVVTLSKAKVELLSVGGKHYIRPDQAFWTMSAGPQQAATIAEVMGDRWALVRPSDKNFADMFDLGDVDQMLAPEGALGKGPIKQINGTSAVGLVDKGPDGGTLYVATVGEPYPLRADGTKAADGAMVFSEFGATFTEINAPASTEVIDFAKLTGA